MRVVMSGAFTRMATIVAFGLVFGCGQKPSFADRETQTQNGADARKAPGEDPTTGDKESNNEGNGTGTDGTTGGTAGDGGSADADATAGTGDGGTVAGTTAGTTDGGTGGTTSGSTDGGTGGTTGGSDGTPPAPKTRTTAMTFAADTTADADVVKDLDTAFLTSEITLVRTYFNRTKELNQITRPHMTDSFTQGNSGAANTEVFNQVANRPLDIVLVIDDSGSMTEEQANMANKLAPLLNAIADTDWQIGVVTTDPNEGSLRKLIKKSDANYMTAFAQAVTAGTNGSDNERGILQAVRSMSGYNQTTPWLRADSTVAVLIVSDEDNCSDATVNNGGDCPNKDYAKSDYLYNYLASIRQPGQNARVYGIIWGPNQTQAQCATAGNQAFVYADVISRTQGLYGSICDTDFTPTLQAVSTNIATVLNSKFTLQYTPDAGSVHVFVDTTELPSTGFTVSGKVVALAAAPADGTKITISYDYGAVPVITNFPLRYTPVAGTVAVKVNGAIVDPSTYTVNYTTPAVAFAAAPPERASIVADYTRDVALSTQFLLIDNIRPGTLTVKVNGVATTAFTEQDAIGLVAFTTAPPDSAVLDFAYQAIGPAVLSYPFAAPYGAPVDLVAYDSGTQAAVRVSYASGNVVINSNDYVEGRQVTLRYDNVERQKFTVDLPNDPIPGVTATGGTLVCKGEPDLDVQGRMVNVDNCGFGDDVAQVRVDYKYVVAAYQDFDYTADKIPAAGDSQVWTVWIGTQVSTDYVRTGGHFHFNQALPVGSTVKIQLIQEDK